MNVIKLGDEHYQSRVLKQTESGKFLFAIAYEYRIKPGVWGADFVYLHAADAADARLQFFASEPTSLHKHMRVVGIAPVVGYQVNDNHGDDLTV